MGEFFSSERMKYLHARLRFPRQYFWRTHDHQELDYVEETDGHLYGDEFKWNPEKAKKPVAFAKAYPKAEVQVLHQHNFEPFLLD